MKNRIFRILLLLALILAGNNAFAAKTPLQAVALSKSVAEMWLLSGGTVTGTTQDALDLENIGNAVSVGTLTTASLELIISLNPQIVLLTQDIPLHKTLNANLKSLGYKTYVVDVKNFGDYKKVLSDFTALNGRRDLFNKNALQVENEIQEVIKKSQEIRKNQQSAGTYLFLRVSTVKNKVLKEHFGVEIFENLGLTPILQDKSSLDDLNVEEIVSKNPDFIFVVAQGDEKRAQEAFNRSFSSNSAWKELYAVKNNRVVVLPRSLFNYKPNNRWALAYETVFKEIYSEK